MPLAVICVVYSGDNSGGRDGVRQDDAAAAAGAGLLPGTQAARQDVLHAAAQDLRCGRGREGEHNIKLLKLVLNTWTC